MSESFDLIVAGTGGVGSAAMLHAAKRGLRVLGIDPHPWGHDRGSSHGQTRIIRMAYFEHPNYVPLLKRCYGLWQELEEESHEQLFFRVGLLQVGPDGGEVLEGVRASAEHHGLSVEWLSADEIRARYPQLPHPGTLVGVFEEAAGYLRVEACVLAHLQLAERLGARWEQTSLCHWEHEGQGVKVVTQHGAYFADRLVLAAGPWTGGLLSEAGICLAVLAKYLHWFSASDHRLRAASGCPAFLYQLDDGVFYGFPQMDQAGVKLAEHTGGQPVETLSRCSLADDPADLQRVERFAGRFAGLCPNVQTTVRCFYTMSPDGHFIVDLHPASERVTFAAGLSGHGFKFTPVLGEVLVDLAIDGFSAHPTGFLRLR